jgi:hypothetical protein
MKKSAFLLIALMLIGIALSSCATKKCPAYAKSGTELIEKRA